MSLKDLISKKAVIQAIDEDDRSGMWSSFLSHDDAQDFKKEIKKLPPAFAGMTNGEVIEALFPREGIWKDVDFVEVIFKGETHTTYFTRDFWDSPYQKGGKK